MKVIEDVEPVETENEPKQEKMKTPHPRPALHSSQSDAGATQALTRKIKFSIRNAI